MAAYEKSCWMDNLLDLLTSWKNGYIYATCLLSLPSFLLYCSQIVVILRHRQFRNSFNALFVSRAIPAFLQMLGSFYGYRLPSIMGPWLLPIFQQLPRWALAIPSFLLYFCFYADNLATGFIQLNRFVVVAWPLAYEKIWHFLLLPSLLIIYGIPVYLTWPILTSMEIQLTTSANDSSFGLREVNMTYTRQSADVVTRSAFAFLLVVSLLSMATLFIYRRRTVMAGASIQPSNGGSGVENGGGGLSDRDSIERKLVHYAMWTFLGHGATALMMYGFHLGSARSSLLFALSPLINDFGTILMPSWLLLWTSATFREQWAADFLPPRLNPWKKWSPPAANLVNVKPAGNLMAGIPAARTMSLGHK